MYASWQINTGNLQHGLRHVVTMATSMSFADIHPECLSSLKYFCSLPPLVLSLDCILITAEELSGRGAGVVI